MVDRKELEGRVAIVTGAGNLRGIGFATARALARAGARIVLADVDRSEVGETAAELISEGADAVCRNVDISREEEVIALLDFVRKDFGRLDILDNNAANQGHAADGLVTELSGEIWDQVMAVNTRGTMFMCKHALPLMVAGGGGSIINISSGTAHAGDFFATAYAASKGAINTFTKYVATQFGAQGIRCNAVAPGIIMTAALEAGMPAPMQDVFREHNLNRILGMPDDVADMVVFLASDRSRYVTGQIIALDGGIYAHIPTTVETSRLATRP